MKKNDFTLDYILSMISSENSFDVLTDLISDMDLEIVDVKIA